MTDVVDQKECCPKFEPEPWDGQIIEWENKKFIKDKVCTFFYMPLNYGSVMKRIMTKIDREGANLTKGMCLSEHTSKWNMNLYLDVDKSVPDTETVILSGKYLCKVYEGDFKETGNWVKDFEIYAQSRSFEISKQYLWYTTCPKCARKYGKNYVVILGELKLVNKSEL